VLHRRLRGRRPGHLTFFFRSKVKGDNMDTQQAYTDRLEAQMRASDARLDQMEAAARARDARAEMDEISGLRARRDRVRQQVADARKSLGDDAETLRRQVDADWTDIRRRIADAHSRYTAWDEARERRFNAHLDEAEAALRESGARDAEAAAGGRAQVAEAQQELREKAAAARREYDAWRGERTDQARQRKLDDAELELEEASNRYAAALAGVSQRGSGVKSS
jgi:hypothetical protein